MANLWETQQSMVDFWKNASEQFQPDKMMDVFEKQLAMWGMKDWGKSGNAATAALYPEWLKYTTQSFQDYLKWVPEGTAKKTMEKIVQASDVYTKLFTFWSDFAVKMPGKEEVEKWQDFSGQMLENYNQVLNSFFAINLPEPLKAMMKNPAEVCGIYQQTCMNLAKPWLESSAEMQEKFQQFMEGDREAHLEFSRLWLENFEETYGKMLGMPIFGQSRETVEKVTKGMRMYTQFSTASNKFSATLYKVGYEAMEKIMQNLASMAKKGEAPENFKDFYKLWWQTNEEAYFELFKSDSFSRLQGEMVDAWVGFKKHNDELLMEIIRTNLPIPTDKDMDSLVKTVSVMKRTIREQGKKIDELEGIISSLSRKGGAPE